MIIRQRQASIWDDVDFRAYKNFIIKVKGDQSSFINRCTLCTAVFGDKITSITIRTKNLKRAKFYATLWKFELLEHETNLCNGVPNE
jgi:hypothetical protein